MFWVIVFLQLWYTFLPVLCFPEGNIANSTSETPLVKRRNLTCFHQPVESCPKPETRCRCHQLPHRKEAAVCCDIVNRFQLGEALACANISNNITALHIRNLTLDFLDLSKHTWRMLSNMSITDGHIKKVGKDFGKHATVSCLNLSSNGIVEFEDRSLVNLYKLKMLDLSNNNLTDLPSLKKDGNISLDISRNNLSCTNVRDMLKSREVNFVNSDDSFCTLPADFTWFSSQAKIPVTDYSYILQLQNECTDNCTCNPHRIDMLPGRPAISAVIVNCADKGFFSLPEKLPQNTVALNMSNNSISSLEMINEESYQSLRELYADNNQITSILPLEGSKFVNNFLHLSLKNNKLKTLPTYFLSNMFDRNAISRHVNLGLNKLHCDCNTAKVLKVWLLTKQKNIPDFEEIYCDNLNMKVIQLDSSKLCQSQQDWTDYIYYIITAEVLLLVLLITKVSYDYWVFKTAGYLPWPASKMPKLPCDWLCE